MREPLLASVLKQVVAATRFQGLDKSISAQERLPISQCLAWHSKLDLSMAEWKFLIQSPVVLQPFNSTERITGLIKQAEEKSSSLLKLEGQLLYYCRRFLGSIADSN